MKFLIYSVMVFSALMGLVLLFFHIKSHKPLRSILKHAAIGLLALIMVNCLTRWTSVHIPVNWWSVAASSFLGIPAVSGIVILQTIFLI